MFRNFLGGDMGDKGTSCGSEQNIKDRLQKNSKSKKIYAYNHCCTMMNKGRDDKELRRKVEKVLYYLRVC